MLEQFGEVEVIGKWNSQDGSKIECDVQKYCHLLNPIQEFEQAVFIDGEDFTGRENEFLPIQKKDNEDNLVTNDEGEPIFETSTYRRFQREVLPARRPTLEEAKSIQVNVFDSLFIREL